MSDYAQTPAVLDHARALAQRDGCARPALARAEGGEYDLIALDAGDVLHDALAVRRPGPAAKSWSTVLIQKRKLRMVNR